MTEALPHHDKSHSNHDQPYKRSTRKKNRRLTVYAAVLSMCPPAGAVGVRMASIGKEKLEKPIGAVGEQTKGWQRWIERAGAASMTPLDSGGEDSTGDSADSERAQEHDAGLPPHRRDSNQC